MDKRHVRKDGAVLAVASRDAGIFPQPAPCDAPPPVRRPRRRPRSLCGPTVYCVGVTLAGLGALAMLVHVLASTQAVGHRATSWDDAARTVTGPPARKASGAARLRGTGDTHSSRLRGHGHATQLKPAAHTPPVRAVEADGQVKLAALQLDDGASLPKLPLQHRSHHDHAALPATDLDIPPLPGTLLKAALKGGSSAAPKHAVDADDEEPSVKFHVGQKVRSTTELRMQNGKNVEVGMVGVVQSVDNLSFAGSVGRVMINGVLFDAREGEIEPADAAHGDVGKFPSLEARLEAEIPQRHWGPETPKKFAELLEQTGCDMVTVPFNPAHDQRCLEYMADTDNWERVRPMTQRFDERTVKYKVWFRHAPLRALIKVPQRLFPFEPTSEVASFHADRVLEVHRVPPTAWVHVSTDLLRKAVKEHATEVQLVDRFRQEAHVKDFEGWVDEELFSFAKERGLEEDGRIGVSAQLFIADVRPLLGSELAIPWTPHDPGWQRTLDPSDQGFGKLHAASYIRQGELAMFDYVLGNGDRSPNKNNFVVGGCRHHRRVEKCGYSDDNPQHPGPPNYVTLDNGMTFMYPLKADRSPDGPNPLLNPRFCAFYGPLLRRLRDLESESKLLHSTQPFVELMKERLPKGVSAVVRTRHLQRCQARIHEVIKQADHCLVKFGKGVVY